MKLIIDIPAVTYEDVKFSGLYLCPRDSEALVNSIKNGTPYEELPHGKCKTCKYFVKGGLDGKTYVCEHPNIEQDDYYNYACLIVEKNDFCSSYEARKKEGDQK